MPSIPTVEVSWTTNPMDTPVWEDETDWFVSFASDEGRIREWERFKASTGTAVFDNSGGRYDPKNTLSPKYPNVRPMKRIRYRETWNGVTYDLWEGFVQSIERVIEYPESARAVFHCLDAFSYLALIPLDYLSFDVLAERTDPYAWYRLGEDTGATSFADSGRTASVGIPVGAPTLARPSLVEGTTDKSVFFPAGTAVRIEQCLVLTLDWTVTFVVDHPALVAGNKLTLIETGDSSGTAIKKPWGWGLAVRADGTDNRLEVEVRSDETAFGEVGTAVTAAGQTAMDGSPHVVTVRSINGGVSIWIDGVDRTSGVVVGVSGPPEVTATTTVGGPVNPANAWNGAVEGLDEVLFHDSALGDEEISALADAALDVWAGDLSGERIDRVLDLIGWPAADRDIATGQTALQGGAWSGNVLEHLQRVAETENGRLFVRAGKVVFHDRHSPLLAPYDTVQATYSDQPTTGQFGYEDAAVTEFAVDLVRNIVERSSQGQSTQTAEDTDSREQYGPRVVTHSGLLTTSTTELRSGAEYELARYKQPDDRVEAVTLVPCGQESTMYPEMLGRRIGDRVKVVVSPPRDVLHGPFAFEQQGIVEGIARTTVGQERRVTFRLSPAETQQFWRWDVSVWDSSTRWAY